MSEQMNGAASETANEVTFARVDGKQEMNNGPLTIIKAKELLDAGKTGVILTGTYIRSVQNKFKKTDYIFATEGGDVLLNGNGSLDKQMKAVQAGELVQISYSGQFPMKEGDFKGKPAHVFVVRRAVEDAG
jgi:hypothetical protein